MGTSIETWRQRIEDAHNEILALPQLQGCGPHEAIRALTRSHLELVQRSNDGRPALPIDDQRDRELALSLESEFRTLVQDCVSQSAKVFLHSERIVPGPHRAASQLSFLAEVCTVEKSGPAVWWCQSPFGSFSYSQGPVATHVQTNLRDQPDADMPRLFSRTPLFSAEAFKEDLKRIAVSGARLAIGHGTPSYAVCLILQALASTQLSPRKFEPNAIGSLSTEMHDENSASVRVVTNCLGVFSAVVERNEFGECRVSLRKAR